jgi:hypothetical protein
MNQAERETNVIVIEEEHGIRYVGTLTVSQLPVTLLGVGVNEYDAIRDLGEKREQQAWKPLYGDD